MSPICGVINHYDVDTSQKINSMMSTLNKRQYGTSCMCINGNIIQDNKTSERVIYGMGQVSYDIRELPIEQPYYSVHNNLTVVFEGNLYNQSSLKDSLGIGESETNSQIIASLIEKYYTKDIATTLKKIAEELDGAFCIAVTDGNQLTIMRDFAGLRPVFYGTNKKFSAFSSSKKALWNIGLRRVETIRAGHMVSFRNGNIRKEQVYSLNINSRYDATDMEKVVDKYDSLLTSAIRKRLNKLNRVGVLLSGGVDSSLIAKIATALAREKNMEVIAYTAGSIGAEDIDYATNLAKELQIKHRVKNLNEDTVRSFVSPVLNTVEERDVVQVEAGVGVYAALNMAREDGIKAIFSGQGPDELWGGYSWYPQVISEEGYSGLEKRMLSDLDRSDIETFDRENKIAMAHGMEQLFPYADSEIINLAKSVPVQMKIFSPEDNIGKRPHRELAKRWGLTDKYADRSKNAAQHGTGVHDMLNMIASENGFNNELVRKADYLSSMIKNDSLGSSTRYGYLFDDRELWQTPEPVQFYLDYLAFQHNLLNEDMREKIEMHLQKAGLITD